MKRPLPKRPAAGFTLLELSIVLVLLGVVLFNMFSVFSSSSRALDVKAAEFTTEAEARRTLDKIAMKLIGAREASLYAPVEQPLFAAQITYEVSQGMTDGEVLLWSEQQRIRQDDLTHHVQWVGNPGSPEELEVTWSRYAREFAAGEEFNGIDDNGNGLIDEKGLSFTREGPMVVIRLTVEKPGPDGEPITKHFETRVTPRN